MEQEGSVLQMPANDNWCRNRDAIWRPVLIIGVLLGPAVALLINRLL